MFSISKKPTIEEVQSLYKEKKATVSEVVRFFFNRSKEVDKDILAVHNYTTELAQVQAESLDKELTETENFDDLIKQKPLFGIPYLSKAIILVEGEICNAGSKVLDGYRATYSSTVYKNITKAGGVILGICNMDEFATGSSGESCYYGKTKNPYDLQRVPGGSSSGSAASIASGQCVFSLGTDTGGSIRQPAAFCGVVGLKPTYGLVSRYGVMAMASSFDQVGPFTNSVKDCVTVTIALSGMDNNDQTSVDSSDLRDRLLGLNQKNLHSRSTNKLVKTDNPMKIGI